MMVPALQARSLACVYYLDACYQSAVGTNTITDRKQKGFVCSAPAHHVLSGQLLLRHLYRHLNLGITPAGSAGIGAKFSTPFGDTDWCSQPPLTSVKVPSKGLSYSGGGCFSGSASGGVRFWLGSRSSSIREVGLYFGCPFRHPRLC